MKTPFLLLFPVLLLSFFLPAQKCTEPDTALMRKNKVKKVNVYFQSNGPAPVLHYTYEYNKRGQLVREKEGGSSVGWKVYAYDAQNRVSQMTIVTDQNVVVSRTEFRYPAGKAWREVSFYQDNGSGKIELTSVYHYDSLERTIYQGSYRKGILVDARFYTPQKDNQPDDLRDSVVQSYEVIWISGGRMVKKRNYNLQWKNPVTASYFYDPKDGALIRELVEKNDSVKSYEPQYDPEGKISAVLCNGKPLDEIDKQNWIDNHRAFPRPRRYYIDMAEDGLPYADPVPEMKEKRTPVLHKNGLLKEEIVEVNWSRSPIKFTYEYTYW